jgi:nucleotide-binding universal stress UspA family protein
VRVLIATELESRGLGALHFGAALRGLAPEVALEVVHVLPAAVHAWLGAEREHVVTAARTRLVEVLGSTGVDASHARVDSGEDVADHLAALAAEVDLLAVGREVPRGQDAFVRLGSVARRLLRKLPTAVVVCPPGLGADHLGDGPVLLATDALPDSEGAARFAVALAGLLRRRLEILHVVAMPPSWALVNVSSERLAEIRHGLLAAGTHALRPWAARVGLPVDEARVVDGWVVDEVVRYGDELRTPLTVVGSRRLTPLARVFATSTSTELAARSTCPVAVVPQDWGESARR